MDEDERYGIFKGPDALEALICNYENDSFKPENDELEVADVHPVDNIYGSGFDLKELSIKNDVSVEIHNESLNDGQTINESINIDENNCNYVLAISSYNRTMTDVHPYLYTGPYVKELKQKSRRKKRFQCMIDGCNRRFYLEAFYKSHLLLHNKLHFMCKYCKSVLGDKNTLMRHESRHFGKDGCLKLYHCVVLNCGEMFKSSRMLLEHEALDHKKLTMQRFCDKCYKHFDSLYLFVKHKCMFMKESKTFCCLECRKYFKTKPELNKHCKSHSNEVVTCDNCSKDFCKESNLRRHKVVHKGRNYFCNICFANFTFCRTLTDHKNKHHPLASRKDFLFSRNLKKT